MIHGIFYVLHVVGMLVIVFTSIYLFAKKKLAVEIQKKFSTYLMAASHTQLLTGFILFFLLMSQVNHMKIGVKLLFAIEIATTATLYKKKISAYQKPNPVFLIIIISSAIIVTSIAFLWQ
ncbi:MAG: hypothetical protein PHP42_11175 [Bacteroidota bacterium]|nr:hypothetical protein [Bacteroidota bacterium]